MPERDYGGQPGDDEHVVHRDGDGGEDAKGRDLGERRQRRRHEGAHGRERRDEHRAGRAAVRPQHAVGEALGDLGVLVQALAVGVHEHEHVVGADGEDDVEAHGHEAADVLELEDHAVKEQRRRQREQDLGDGRQRDGERLRLEPQPAEDDEHGADGERQVHEDDDEELVLEQRRREVQHIHALVLRLLDEERTEVVLEPARRLGALLGLSVAAVVVPLQRPAEAEDAAREARLARRREPLVEVEGDARADARDPHHVPCELEHRGHVVHLVAAAVEGRHQRVQLPVQREDLLHVRVAVRELLVDSSQDGRRVDWLAAGTRGRDLQLDGADDLAKVGELEGGVVHGVVRDGHGAVEEVAR
mmetsp:Transcript_21686/g.76148  ORF Transcript_21686/g.76148 Transcript_21686/m.76148 type:complete len:360 (+) Transcript_21686:1646-2725(+)